MCVYLCDRLCIIYTVCVCVCVYVIDYVLYIQYVCVCVYVIDYVLYIQYSTYFLSIPDSQSLVRIILLSQIVC